MAVAISAVGTPSITTNSTNVTTKTYTGITVNSGDTALICFANIGGNVSDPTGITATWGGTSMTSLVTQNSGSGHGGCVIFGLRSPASGTQNLVLNWTNANQPNICAISVTGSDTTSDANAFPTAGRVSALATSLNVSSGTGHMTVAGVGWSGNITSLTTTSSTSVYVDTTSSGNDSAMSRAPGATTVTWTESGGTGTDCGLVAIDIAPSTATQNPFMNYDWPNPQGTVWYQSWEEWAQQTPTVKTTFGGNYPWPNPFPVYWYRSAEEFGNSLTAITSPFFQNVDFPLPVVLQPINQTWLQSLNLFFQSETFPFVQKDWPNAQRIIWYRDWSENLLQTTLKPAPQAPFVQYDWPNPRTYQPIDQTYYQSNINSTLTLVLMPFVNEWFDLFDNNPINQTWIQNLLSTTLSTPGQKPFNQSDWPLPYPIQWYKDWYQALSLYLPTVFPFSQTNWPNPKTYLPIDQFWSNNLNLLPQVNTTKPFNQSDWPNPKDYQRIDENFWQALALILPPPPPPPEITSSGRTWTREEWTKKLTQYVQQRQKLLTFSDMGKMGGRPRKS